MTTVAPSRAAAWATANPIPELPPSTTMRLPCNVMPDFNSASEKATIAQ
jgi:hypothetical protein